MFVDAIESHRLQSATPSAAVEVRRRLGQSDISLTLLGFGAAPVGNLYRAVSDQTASSTVQAALQCGIRYFDTAPYYGFGLSERRLGAALSRHEPAAGIIISSKVGRLLRPAPEARPGQTRCGFAAPPPLEPVYDYSYDGVMRSFEASCERLGRQHIDILLAHDLGFETHGEQHQHVFRTFMDGGYRAMQALRDSGAIGAIGVGANEWQVCESVLRNADVDGFLLAGRYTLLDQSAAESFLPLCARRGASIVLGGPFNSGILATGSVGQRGAGCYNYAPPSEDILERVRALEAVCREFDIPLAAAALQFPAAHPQVASVVAGMADPEEVERACRFMDVLIPDDFWCALQDRGFLSDAAVLPVRAPVQGQAS